MRFDTEFNDKQIEILLVAESLFAENGFEGTSIRTIAKEAKINIAMVSYYFGSKEKLLEALVFYRTKELQFEIANLFLENVNPIEKIEKLVALYINKINYNKGIYRIIHFEIAKEKSNLKMQVLDELRNKNLKVLTAIIKEGQEKGVFRKDIIIPLISPTILGTFFHFHMNKPYFQNLLDLPSEEAFDTFIKTQLTQHIQQIIKALLIHEN
ncbi:TetR/AcrR family transcriptional regulator [Flavobacterium sp. UMI-01]|uniref:TetR/AcrR family transcriptional regulator n=1 Tax=Flavobacterium sp. UMI-01 TaxID=1441053 RepID=UPI001C7D068A|nr:TetR/AcrR family transcriptional regulator [Flavobacterium sp. UMI-01]GIZ10482.1 TetR family transcriptional regulator [Flavobacterium sp. UMI-01]